MLEKDNNNYIWLFNRYKTIDTVKKFMDREYIYGITPQDFFKLNRDLIFQQYSSQDKYKEKDRAGKWPESAKDLTVDSFLPCPCVLRIQPTKVSIELSISQTNFQEDVGDYYAFADEQISRILQNEGYQIDAAEKLNPTVQVFGWFKSLYTLKQDETNKSISIMGKSLTDFANLSKHIQNLSTLSEKNGASFSFRLPIIDFDVNQIISFTNKEYTRYIDKLTANTNNATYNYDGQFYSKTDYSRVENNYYNWLISSNDLVFISFEKLEMEMKRNENSLNIDENNFDIKTLIANNVFDIIGLVDEVRVVGEVGGASAYVEVTGRDLMKLLIEDGSFFFNPSTTVQPSMVFYNEQSYRKQGDIRDVDKLDGKYQSINRLRRVTGEIDVFKNNLNMNLDYVLKGVISQLANIEVVPSFVFDSWGASRTKVIELQPKKGTQPDGAN